MKTSEEAITSTFSAAAPVQKIMMRKNFCFVRFSRYCKISFAHLPHEQDIFSETFLFLLNYVAYSQHK